MTVLQGLRFELAIEVAFMKTTSHYEKWMEAEARVTELTEVIEMIIMGEVEECLL